LETGYDFCSFHLFKNSSMINGTSL
jgi:hypothetical protein